MITVMRPARVLAVLVGLATITLLGMAPARALGLDVPAVTVTPPAVDLLPTPAATNDDGTPSGVPALSPLPTEDPVDLLGENDVNLGPLLDDLADPTGGEPDAAPGGGGPGGGTTPVTDGTTPGGARGTPTGRSPNSSTPGSSQLPATSGPGAPYGAYAGASLLHAAGRAVELAGSLTVPLLFGIAAMGFLIAVSSRPARLLKGDRLPFRRSYRI